MPQRMATKQSSCETGADWFYFSLRGKPLQLLNRGAKVLYNNEFIFIKGEKREGLRDSNFG